MTEQKPSDIAIVDLINACKFAAEHLSPDQFAQAVMEGTDTEFLTMVHGKLALKIIEHVPQ